tara:strand:+ start:606 stop:2180 length:1575 start_codon:yes stop_codon:yes gene_type:complete
MNTEQKTQAEIIAELQRALAQKENLLIQNTKSLLEKDQRIAILEEIIRLEKMRGFGSSSEKTTDQQDMFNEAELGEAHDEIMSEDEQLQDTQDKTQTSAKPKRGRKALPKDLPRIYIEHDLSEHEKTCACGCQKTQIGEETSEQLDIIPAKIQVIVNVRKKYACQQCEDKGIQTAALPAQPIPKSNAAPGLLAHVAVSKYQDALPLYRLQAILPRSGIDLPRNTLANWMIKTGQLIQPLINLLEDKLLSYPILHCDETHIQVLQEPGKTAQSNSYMWVRVGGPPTQPVRLFHYADSRRSDVASDILTGYQGYLHTDDYAGYNGIAQNKEITQLGCWAHVRRKFIDAQKANKTKNKTSKADMAINLIGKLYAIEKHIEEATPEEKHQARQEQSKAQLQKIKDWLDKTLHTTVPKGLLGKALSYMNKNWDKLTVYIEDGRLNIDNNPAENAIRPFVVGRKNWLFSATVQGAKSSANLYSLIETAKANGLEPYEYLRKVFTELPKAKSVEEIEALLPWNVTLQEGVS